ncbi:MAG: hypothetical protein R3B93_05490 [Bacteroidia bacterium]
MGAIVCREPLVHSLTSIASSDNGQIYAGGVRVGGFLIVGSQIATGVQISTLLSWILLGQANIKTA